MKLSCIVKSVKNVQIYPSDMDVEIEEITKFSGDKTQNGMYFCLRGSNYDGHNYAAESVKTGAVCIVTEKILPKVKCVQVITNDVRLAFAKFSATFYGDPQKKLKIIGVVGTNGKTSTATMIYEMLNLAGKNCAFIGTLGVKYNDQTLEESLTTPDPDYLYKLFKTFVDGGVMYVVMELSAHAIWLKKASAICFECLIFTNCTQDHLDYFVDYSSYRMVKKSAFDKKSRFFIVNTDDSLGQEIYSENPKKTLTYGIYTPADVFAVNIKESLFGTSFVINMFDMVYNVECDLLGEFNVSNLLASASACFLCGIKPEKIVKYIKKLKVVSGRMECVGEYMGGKIFIDYAHTPDGLNKSLSFLSSTTNGKTIALFGAGGNRDTKKRSVMGKIAGDIADFVIITSDNPRYEDPLSIINDIEMGIKSVTKEYKVVPDRYDAIRQGILSLNMGDSLLIAGKGSENYQEINGNKLGFSDKQVVLSIIGELEGQK